jgi:hypothetical protein
MGCVGAQIPTYSKHMFMYICGKNSLTRALHKHLHAYMASHTVGILTNYSLRLSISGI